MLLKDLVDSNVGLPLERKRRSYLNEKSYTYNSLTLKSFASALNISADTTDQFIASEQIGTQYLAETNNVIVRLRAPVRAIYIDVNNSGLLISSLMAKITIIFPNLLDSRYLALFINSVQAQNQLQKNLKNTTIPMVKISDIMNLEISLPSLDEQIKIVQFIEASSREIELLNQLIEQKSNLRNQIFDNLTL
ncbi:MAG TPA: restriction endonuclease subunit S [Aquella sp.]|nr:restriction endonuclease subunit S [Aquella sp.]